MALWTSSVFVEEARGWVAAQLAPRGSRLTGEWKQPHARVWSSTIWFETTEGRVWFKVNGSGTAYEPALIALLRELRPGLALAPGVAPSLLVVVGAMRSSGRASDLKKGLR